MNIAIQFSRKRTQNAQKIFYLRSLRSLAAISQIKKARREPRFEIFTANLILRRGFGHHVHAAAFLVEHDLAVREGEQCPVATGADIFARDKFAAALANDDAAGGDERAAKFFYAKPFADAVASVLDAALTFFMCHKFFLRIFLRELR